MIYKVRNSEKCFRFKPDALEPHAPMNKGIYELVTFDENQKPTVLYVGAAFEKTIYECMSGHMNGTLEPKGDDLLAKHGNLYFDFLTELNGAKTEADAQDIYWWLVQKYKPAYNDVTNIKPTNPPESIEVVELD